MISRIHPDYTSRELVAALRPPADAVARLERELAAHLGVAHAVAFPYGRAAIHGLLRAADLKGEVVQPAYNCLAVAHATVAAECRPVFVDAAVGDPNQSADAMAAAVTASTVAVCPTSALGVTFDAPSLCERIRQRNHRALILIDCCLSLDAGWDGQGLARFGDAAVVAFGNEKPVTAPFGGALVTGRADLADLVRRYRDATFRPPSATTLRRRWLYFLVSWMTYSRFGVLAGDAVRRGWRSYVLGTPNLRQSIAMPADAREHLSPMAAAIGLIQLERAAERRRRRAEVGTSYAARLHDVPGLRLLAPDPRRTFGFFYPAQVAEAEVREGVLEALERRGVSAGTVWNYVVPDLECYRELGYAASPFPNAVRWSRTILNLPNHPRLTLADVGRTVTAVRAAFDEVAAAAAGAPARGTGETTRPNPASLP